VHFKFYICNCISIVGAIDNLLGVESSVVMDFKKGNSKYFSFFQLRLPRIILCQRSIASMVCDVIHSNVNYMC
jgi:hypothetical protein